MQIQFEINTSRKCTKKHTQLRSCAVYGMRLIFLSTREYVACVMTWNRDKIIININNETHRHIRQSTAHNNCIYSYEYEWYIKKFATQKRFFFSLSCATKLMSQQNITMIITERKTPNRTRTKTVAKKKLLNNDIMSKLRIYIIVLYIYNWMRGKQNYYGAQKCSVILYDPHSHWHILKIKKLYIFARHVYNTYFMLFTHSAFD